MTEALVIFCAILVAVWIGRWSVLHDFNGDRRLEAVKAEWRREDWLRRLDRRRMLKRRFEGRGGGAA